MTFNVSIYDLISWLVTVISLMLFYFERKKNNRLPYYMAIQGILRACKSKAAGNEKRYCNKKCPGQDEGGILAEAGVILLLSTYLSSVCD